MSSREVVLLVSAIWVCIVLTVRVRGEVCALLSTR
jgi:hypothetical protein